MFFFFFLTRISAHIGLIQVLFQTVPDRIGLIQVPFLTTSDHISPNKKKLKKNRPRMCIKPCPWPHGASVRIGLGFAGQIGAPVLPSLSKTKSSSSRNITPCQVQRTQKWSNMEHDPSQTNVEYLAGEECSDFLRNQKIDS